MIIQILAQWCFVVAVFCLSTIALTMILNGRNQESGQYELWVDGKKQCLLPEGSCFVCNYRSEDGWEIKNSRIRTPFRLNFENSSKQIRLTVYKGKNVRLKDVIGDHANKGKLLKEDGTIHYTLSSYSRIDIGEKKDEKLTIEICRKGEHR